MTTAEERLEFEQATGIRADDVQKLVGGSIKQTEDMLTRAIRELQEVIGPHGAVSRLQAGGVRIARGSGIGVFTDGIQKTTIDTDGNLFVGSDVAEASTTTLCVFVNDQPYNNEQMYAGDLLIGDNSESSPNIKYNATEDRLEFRIGTTVNIFMDTEGALTIANNVTGISFSATDPTKTAYLKMADDDNFEINNTVAGKGIYLYITLTDASTPAVSWGEDGANANVSQLNAAAGTSGGKISIDTEVVIWAKKDGVETVFNEGSYDIDHRFEGATDANLLKLDGGLDAIGMGGAAQSGYKLKVTGDTSLDGALIVNDSGADKDTVIETNNQTQAFYMDGGLDKATSFAWDGWQACDETWTRTGDFTFTVSGDVTNKFRKGTKVRYTDSGVEYGVVASSSYSGITLLTTVTLITNTDYAMSGNPADRFISYIENPERFSHWFNWNPNPQGFSAVPTSTAYRFTTYGNAITLQYTEAGNGTSNATTFTASAPIAPQQACSAILSATVDNNVLQTTPGRVALTSGSTTMTLREDTANGAWTNASGKRAVFFITYEF